MNKRIHFKLGNEFVAEYAKKTPPFGFNGLGELTYMRTYSRLICPKSETYKFHDKIDEDGVRRAYSDKHPDTEMVNEKWHQTVRRVVEGTYTMQKRHVMEHDLGWSNWKAHRSAEEMYDRMWNMKFLPPGRGLWAMGTDITDERGLFAALNNCAFVSTENLSKSNDESTKPFEFLMDMSMLGVGVGFDLKGADSITLQQPIKGGTFIIPDTREGWVESVKAVLMAFFAKNTSLPTMDYSKIRKKGEPIKTFGGEASGPEPLKLLHDQLIEIFSNRQDQRITERDITDVMNMIGACVVAGNVRRTAEIVFGDPNSEEYLGLKNYSWDGEKYTGPMAERASYGWTSNNSVFAELGMDYTRVGDQTALNGEPGYGWLANMQAFGRMIDPPNYRDKRAKGANPCVEQTLESYELCCLVETFPSLAEDLEDYKRTLKFAYLYAKTVTLGKTHWIETNRVMLRNRRIGASQSGIINFLDKQGIETYRQWCEEGYQAIERWDDTYSDWLCIPKSIKKTSVKPSGTVSLLPGVLPGMHHPEDTCYIRRMRINSNNPLVQRCIDAGYHVEDDVVSKGTSVISIPVKVDVQRTVSEVSMWEQLSLAAFIQRHWADNQVSCTVTFQKHEADQIKHALNYFQYQLKGVSFLPQTEVGAYAQMPYEGIDRETFEQMSGELSPINFSNVGVDSTPEKFCDGDNCEIVITPPGD